MEMFSALLVLCEGNSTVDDKKVSNAELYIFLFAVNLNKLLNKHSSGHALIHHDAHDGVVSLLWLFLL